MSRKLPVISIVFLSFACLFCDTALAQAQVIYRKLAFKDEFNKAANSPVDSTKWTAEIGGAGWGNQELQYYTNDIENAYHDGAVRVYRR